MKPLHRQRIKQGQRILLISENQKGGGGGVPLHFVLLLSSGKVCVCVCRGGKKKKRKNNNGQMPQLELHNNCWVKKETKKTVVFEVKSFYILNWETTSHKSLCCADPHILNAYCVGVC